MNNLIAFYKQQFNLEDAEFCRIDHDDAMVALVYRIVTSNGEHFILKICQRPNDYWREIYFLEYFANQLPVPQIIQSVQPKLLIHGAVLMECLPGSVLKIKDFSPSLAHQAGSLLAQIHSHKTSGYGDLIDKFSLSPDPRIYFTMKFEEGLDECAGHFPPSLIHQCRNYFDSTIDLLLTVDGPCIVHRDFRPGNIVASNDKIQGIIDWSSTRASFAEEDFCSMEHIDWEINSSTRRDFLAGYSSVRPIPAYERILPFLRLSKSIATIGFIVKRNAYDSNIHLYNLNRQYIEALFKNQ